MPISQKIFFKVSDSVTSSGSSSEKNFSTYCCVVGQCQKKCVKFSSGAGNLFASLQNVHDLSMVVPVTMCANLFLVGIRLMVYLSWKSFILLGRKLWLQLAAKELSFFKLISVILISAILAKALTVGRFLALAVSSLCAEIIVLKGLEPLRNLVRKVSIRMEVPLFAPMLRLLDMCVW